MHIVSTILFAVSGLLFLLGLGWFFTFSTSQRSTKRLLTLTVLVVLAILFLKASETVFRKAMLVPSGILIETMQSFSMDADYSGLLDPHPGTQGLWATMSVWYKVILFSVAPIAGGAVVYDVLVGISPDIQLFIVRHKRLMVFSELNDRTITLAESFVTRSSKDNKCALVFTDCYTQNEEKSAELMIRAKNLHAICLQDDLIDCHGFRHSALCSYYLMDETESGSLDDESNLIALEGILSNKELLWDKRRGCSITLFTNSNETVESICALKKTYVDEEDDQLVEVHVIRDYAMACFWQLKEAPLYKTLHEVIPKQPVDVVIFGRTAFAWEMFRSVFSFGQLTDHPLRITMLARAAEICDFTNEIKKTCPELLSSCEPNNECLRIKPGDPETAPIYASLCFVQEDPLTTPVRDLLTAERKCQYGDKTPFTLAEAQRFFVMAGNDEENVALADEIRRCLIYLFGTKRTPELRPSDAEKRGSEEKIEKIVSIAVERGELYSVLKQRFCKYVTQDKNSTWIEMQLFGSMKDRYTWQTVSFNGADLACVAELRQLEKTRHSAQDVGVSSDDIYNEWSRIARAFHEPYKMFCAGIVDKNETARKRIYAEKLREEINKESSQSHSELLDDLRWQEHRRWCAFLRSEGFSYPAGLHEIINRLQADENAFSSKEWQTLLPYAYKNIPARLQPCLVESSRHAQKDTTDMLECVSNLRRIVETGKKSEEKMKKAEGEERWKSNEHCGLKYDDLGLKYYDSPYGEFGPRITEEELLELFSDEIVAAGETPKAWIEKAEIEYCQTAESSGIYYLDLVLDQLDKLEEVNE